MKRILGVLVSVTALGGTAFLLLADGARTCPDQKAQEVTFDVTGDCGAQGELRLTATDRSCWLSATAAEEVGLPTENSDLNTNGGDLREGGWGIAGALPGQAATDGGGVGVTRYRRCDAAKVEGVLLLRCHDDGAEQVSCTATLVPR